MSDHQEASVAHGITLADLQAGCPPHLLFCKERSEWGCFGLDAVAYAAKQEDALSAWRNATGSDKVARVLSPEA